MVDQRLIDYIREQISYGIPREEIKASLLASGWRKEDVEAGFKIFQAPSHEVPPPPERNVPPPPAPPGKTGEVAGQAGEVKEGKIKEEGKKAGKAGFAVSLVAGIILIMVLSLNFLVFFLSPDPDPVITYLLGGTSEADYIQMMVRMKSPTGLISSLILLFFVAMLFYAVSKLRDPEKHGKMGKFIIVYSVIIVVVTFGSYTGLVGGALGIIGGMLGWKGK